MTNNVKVARAILAAKASGQPITIRAIAEAAGTRRAETGVFMARWKILNWLAVRQDRCTLYYSVTDLGDVRLAELVRQSGDDGGSGQMPWPQRWQP